jgi:hypothetical protein
VKNRLAEVLANIRISGCLPVKLAYTGIGTRSRFPAPPRLERGRVLLRSIHAKIWDRVTRQLDPHWLKLEDELAARLEARASEFKAKTKEAAAEGLRKTGRLRPRPRTSNKND